MSLDTWAKRWNAPTRRETVGKKIKEFINPPASLKQQIINAVYRINTQIHRLDYSLGKLQIYDKQLFEKVVNALVEGDKTRATMYANEVAEIRKMAKIILTVKYALEKVKIKLDTALIVGDTHANLAPAIVALKQVAGYMRGMMPDVYTELLEIDEALQAGMMQITANVPVTMDNTIVTEEAQKILRDASIVAEQRLRQQFPELPSFEHQVPSSTQAPGATIEEGK
ncbi:MAG: Snf7 family protein [Desulfurococcales archaeon]|nr:Snf7 family protein [Desulfurococcales archaeon]